jgi:hypothetical protein
VYPKRQRQECFQELLLSFRNIRFKNRNCFGTSSVGLIAARLHSRTGNQQTCARSLEACRRLIKQTIACLINLRSATWTTRPVALVTGNSSQNCCWLMQQQQQQRDQRTTMQRRSSKVCSDCTKQSIKSRGTNATGWLLAAVLVTVSLIPFESVLALSTMALCWQ